MRLKHCPVEETQCCIRLKVDFLCDGQRKSVFVSSDFFVPLDRQWKTLRLIKVSLAPMTSCGCRLYLLQVFDKVPVNKAVDQEKNHGPCFFGRARRLSLFTLP